MERAIFNLPVLEFFCYFFVVAIVFDERLEEDFKTSSLALVSGFGCCVVQPLVGDLYVQWIYRRAGRMIIKDLLEYQ